MLSDKQSICQPAKSLSALAGTPSKITSQYIELSYSVSYHKNTVIPAF